MDTIFNAIRSGDYDQVKSFLSNTPELINTKDQRGSTPLLLATYYGVEDIVKLILEYNPDVNIQDLSLIHI